jgi:hypothetical protein
MMISEGRTPLELRLRPARRSAARESPEPIDPAGVEHLVPALVLAAPQQEFAPVPGQPMRGRQRHVEIRVGEARQVGAGPAMDPIEDGADLGGSRRMRP